MGCNANGDGLIYPIALPKTLPLEHSPGLRIEG